MIRVAGEIISGPEVIAMLVEKQLRGDAVWVERDDVSPEPGMMRAMSAAPEYRDAFARALRSLASSEDLRVRRLAMRCLDALA
jgi:hypothetical protein